MDTGNAVIELWKKLIENPENTLSTPFSVEEKLIPIYPGPILALASKNYLFNYIYGPSISKLTRSPMFPQYSDYKIVNWDQQITIFELGGKFPISVSGILTGPISDRKTWQQITLYISDQCPKYGTGYGELVLGKYTISKWANYGCHPHPKTF